MKAKEMFNQIVAENYKEAKADPANLRKLWNAVVLVCSGRLGIISPDKLSKQEYGTRALPQLLPSPCQT